MTSPSTSFGVLLGILMDWRVGGVVSDPYDCPAANGEQCQYPFVHNVRAIIIAQAQASFKVRK